MLEREVYKFQWNSLIEVAEAYAELSTAYTIKDSIKAFAKLSAVVIPASLRLTPKEKAEIPLEDLIEYMPKIMEVNKGFFSALPARTTETIESLLTSVHGATPTLPSQKKELVQKN